MSTAFDHLEDAGGILFHVDPRDKDPRSEEKRQLAFRRAAKMLCPGVHITPLLNDGKRTLWEQNKAKRLGMTAGEPDLELTWANRGIAWMEFKSGTGTVSPAQRDRLNQLVRFGHSVGVFRQETTALEWLRRCGAPFVGSFS